MKGFYKKILVEDFFDHLDWEDGTEEVPPVEENIDWLDYERPFSIDVC